MFNALTTKQKYLHTVDSPSFCIVLNSPDDSLFFNLFPDTSLPPVIALSQLGHKKIPAHKKAIILNVIYFSLKNELLHHVRQTR